MHARNNAHMRTMRVSNTLYSMEMREEDKAEAKLVDEVLEKYEAGHRVLEVPQAP